MTRRVWLALFLIFLVAILVRFLYFKDSIYFGYDQARDAFISRSIYLDKEFKLIGPPASGDSGLFHGPLFWYIIGPLYLSGGIEFVSAIFRLVNAMGVFLVYGIGSSLFSPVTGIIAAFLFAISFEQSQYSFFVNNPAFSGLSILFMVLGFTWVIKKDSRAKWAPLLILGGASSAIQFNLMYSYLILFVFTGLVLFRSYLKNIPLRMWIVGLLISMGFLSSYILAELKYGFRMTKLGLSLFRAGYGVMDRSESKLHLFLGKFIAEFKDNLLGNMLPGILIYGIVILFVIWLIFKAIKSVEFRLLMLWIFGWAFLMVIGGHSAYYTNSGLSIGVIMAIAYLLEKTKGGPILWGSLLMIFSLNFIEIIYQNKNSLIKELCTQTMLKIGDEKRVIDYMYEQSKGHGFTVRITGIPYTIPTTWAYLYNSYGFKQWGYYPYFEYGKVLGYPGELPTPSSGTSCIRYRVVEPNRGLPDTVIKRDIKLENGMSFPVKAVLIGDYFVETRLAKDSHCHFNKPDWKVSF